ncbi:MAG: class I SAM-dependent methyltransferase [Collinsella sp.]
MDDLSMCAYRAASARAACEADQSRADRALDVAVAGEPLAALGDPTVLGGGACEPTPTPYWILDDLLGIVFERTDRLLDVGCGAGRVLAYAVATQLPCRVTGVEPDGRLAARAASWTRGRDGLEVIAGSALDIPFGAYTHFYLFNPFDQVLLVEFLDRLEAQVRRPITLMHMSDNGESFAYLGRAGWMRERRVRFIRIRLAVSRFSGTLSTTHLALRTRCERGGGRACGITGGVVPVRLQRNDLTRSVRGTAAGRFRVSICLGDAARTSRVESREAPI